MSWSRQKQISILASKIHSLTKKFLKRSIRLEFSSNSESPDPDTSNRSKGNSVHLHRGTARGATPDQLAVRSEVYAPAWSLRIPEASFPTLGNFPIAVMVQGIQKIIPIPTSQLLQEFLKVREQIFRKLTNTAKLNMIQMNRLPKTQVAFGKIRF